MTRKLTPAAGLLLGLGLATLTGCLGLAPVSTPPAGPPLEVFVFAGQSNMVGHRGEWDELPEELRRPLDSVLVFDGGQWLPLQATPESEQFGPELSFAHRLAEARGRIGLIKHAVGGTSLSRDWSPDGGPLLAELIAKIEAARATRELHLAAVLWMQGESDARNEQTAKAYGDRLLRLIERLRRDLAAPNMLFVAGRVNPPVSERFPFGDLVRRAQESCPAQHYAMVDCDPLSKHEDGIHYDTAGLVDLGRAFAGVVLDPSRAVAQ